MEAEVIPPFSHVATIAEMPEQLPKPTLIAFIVCDSVYHDTIGKTALVGLFDSIHAGAFPATHNRFCVFITFTSVRPNTDCKLEIVDAEDQEILSMEGEIGSDTPTRIYEVTFDLQNVTFPVPGQYMIRFITNGEVLAQRRLGLGLIDGEPHDNEE